MGETWVKEGSEFRFAGGKLQLLSAGTEREGTKRR